MSTLQPTLVISTANLTEMLSEGLRKFPLETGGILMGFETDQKIFVTAVIGPGPRAVHHRRSFVPDTEWQRQRVGDVYARSGRTEQYLGDWHTHPRGTPNASVTDFLAARSIARYKPARCPHPLMLIVAVAGPDDAALAAYRWRRGLLRHVDVTMVA